MCTFVSIKPSDDSLQRNAASRSSLALGKLERALHDHAKRSIEPSSGGFFKSRGSRRAMSSTSPRRRRRSPANMVRTPPPTRAAGRRRCRGARSWQSGGEKPRATTVLKMTHDEIRAAVSAADEPAVVSFFLKRNPASEEKNTGQIAKPKAERKKREEKITDSPCTANCFAAPTHRTPKRR